MTNYTLQIQSPTVPALYFTINEQGQNIGVWWKVEAEGYQELAADKTATVETNRALYFNEAGFLNLSKWLALHQDYKAQIAACEAKANALDSEYENLCGLQFTAALCACLAPANTIDLLASKAEHVAYFLGGMNGDTGHENAILKSLAYDARSLASNEPEIQMQGAA